MSWLIYIQLFVLYKIKNDPFNPNVWRVLQDPQIIFLILYWNNTTEN
jgi:hypothetical protein